MRIYTNTILTNVSLPHLRAMYLYRIAGINWYNRDVLSIQTPSISPIEHDEKCGYLCTDRPYFAYTGVPIPFTRIPTEDTTPYKFVRKEIESRKMNQEYRILRKSRDNGLLFERVYLPKNIQCGDFVVITEETFDEACGPILA